MKFKNGVKTISLLSALLMLLFLAACGDSGSSSKKTPETEEEESVSASRTGLYSPTTGYDGQDFYIVTGNSAIEGNESSWNRGLPLLKSDKLSVDSFVLNGYILSGVIKNWAKARLLELDSSIDTSDIIMDHPCLREMDDNTWRLYYSVSAGTQASVIGYATASSPDGTWTDQGEILYSDSSSSYKASAPNFCSSTDGDYLAFGENYGGIYGVELNSDGSASGSPVLLSYCSSDDADTQRIAFPVLFYSDGYYHLYSSYDDQSIVQSASSSALGSYYDFSNYELSSTTGGFANCRILTGYYFSDSTYYYTNPNNGIDVFDADGQNFAVHQMSLNGAKPTVFFRKLNFIDGASMTIANLSSGTSLIVDASFPSICPEPYNNDEYTDNITINTICSSNWDYGSLSYLNSSNTYNYAGDVELVFSNDGTYCHSGDSSQGGTWTYSSNILHITSYSWSEDIYLYVCWSGDSENSNVSQTLVASGINATDSSHQGIWMKQQR